MSIYKVYSIGRTWSWPVMSAPACSIDFCCCRSVTFWISKVNPCKIYLLVELAVLLPSFPPCKVDCRFLCGLPGCLPLISVLLCWSSVKILCSPWEHVYSGISRLPARSRRDCGSCRTGLSGGTLEVSLPSQNIVRQTRGIASPHSGSERCWSQACRPCLTGVGHRQASVFSLSHLSPRIRLERSILIIQTI